MVSKLSDGEIKRVVQRYEEGEGAVAIAKDYPVTPRAIYGLLDRRGIERRSVSETLREDVEKRYCKNCGEEIPRGENENPSRYEKRVFCSHKCHIEFKKKNAKYDTSKGDRKICKYCGSVFYSFRDEAKYCSRKCAYEDRDGRTEVECDNCGKSFETCKSDAEKGEHNFCSEECSRDFFRGENHYNWKGGRQNYRGKYWNQTREKVLERDGHKCVVCGKEENLQVHHKIPVSEFDSYKEANKLSNLITLCSSHHVKADRVYQSQGVVLYD